MSDAASVVTILSVLRDLFCKIATQRRSELEVELKTNQKTPNVHSIPSFYIKKQKRGHRL